MSENQAKNWKQTEVETLLLEKGLIDNNVFLSKERSNIKIHEYLCDQFVNSNYEPIIIKKTEIADAVKKNNKQISRYFERYVTRNGVKPIKQEFFCYDTNTNILKLSEEFTKSIEKEAEKETKIIESNVEDKCYYESLKLAKAMETKKDIELKLTKYVLYLFQKNLSDLKERYIPILLEDNKFAFINCKYFNFEFNVIFQRKANKCFINVENVNGFQCITKISIYKDYTEKAIEVFGIKERIINREKEVGEKLKLIYVTEKLQFIDQFFTYYSPAFYPVSKDKYFKSSMSMLDIPNAIRNLPDFPLPFLPDEKHTIWFNRFQKKYILNEKFDENNFIHNYNKLSIAYINSFEDKDLYNVWYNIYQKETGKNE